MSSNSSRTLFAFGDKTGKVGIWRPHEGDSIKIYSAHDTTITSLLFINGEYGTVLATAGKDGLLKLWDSNFQSYGKDKKLLFHAYALGENPSQRGDIIIFNGNSIGYSIPIDPPRGTSFWSKDTEGHGTNFTLSVNKWAGYVIAGFSDGYIAQWTLSDTSDSINFRQIRESLGAIMASDIGSDGEELIIGTSRGDVHILSSRSLDVSYSISVGNQIRSTKFSPGNDLAVIGCKDGSVVFWDFQDGNHMIYRKHNKAVVGLAFSEDEDLVISCSLDGQIIIWDRSDLSEKNRIHWPDL